MIDKSMLNYARKLFGECSVKGTDWASAMQAMLEGNIVRRVGWADVVTGICMVGQETKNRLWKGKPHILLLFKGPVNSPRFRWDSWTPYDSDFTATDWIVVEDATALLETIDGFPVQKVGGNGSAT